MMKRYIIQLDDSAKRPTSSCGCGQRCPSVICCRGGSKPRSPACPKKVDQRRRKRIYCCEEMSSDSEEDECCCKSRVRIGSRNKKPCRKQMKVMCCGDDSSDSEDSCCDSDSSDESQDGCQESELMYVIPKFLMMMLSNDLKKCNGGERKKRFDLFRQCSR